MLTSVCRVMAAKMLVFPIKFPRWLLLIWVSFFDQMTSINFIGDISATPRHFVLNYWWQRCRWGGGLGALTIILWSFIFLETSHCVQNTNLIKLRRKSWDAILLRGFFKMAAKVKAEKSMIGVLSPRPILYSLHYAPWSHLTVFATDNW